MISFDKISGYNGVSVQLSAHEIPIGGLYKQVVMDRLNFIINLAVCRDVAQLVNNSTGAVRGRIDQMFNLSIFVTLWLFKKKIIFIGNEGQAYPKILFGVRAVNRLNRDQKETMYLLQDIRERPDVDRSEPFLCWLVHTASCRLV